MHDVTLAVLGGGEGRRMGRPKAQLRIGGEPILTRLLDRLDWPGPTMLITAPGRERPPGAGRFDRELTDPVSGEGPLRGVFTALQGATTPVVIVIPLDMPNLTRPPLEWLARELLVNAKGSANCCNAVLLRRDGAVEPLPAAFRAVPASEFVRRRLLHSDRSLRGLATEASVDLRDAPRDWPASLWKNINHPHDLSERLDETSDSR